MSRFMAHYMPEEAPPPGTGQPTMRRWGGSIWPTGAQRMGHGWRGRRRIFSGMCCRRRWRPNRAEIA